MATAARNGQSQDLARTEMTRIGAMRVMKVQCASCPFREGFHNRGLVEKVTMRALTEASQICHHPRTKGKKETHLCRGARDIQLSMFFQIGFISAPTDEAWDAKRKELGIL